MQRLERQLQHISGAVPADVESRAAMAAAASTTVVEQTRWTATKESAASSHCMFNGELMTEADVTGLKNIVGGEENYQNMIQWASQNVSEGDIEMFDAVMDSGDPRAAFFAIQAMAYRYQDAVGTEGKMVQGKAPSQTENTFRSQAELVNAMNDPRYERDAAYRNDIMRKLELSDINF